MKAWQEICCSTSVAESLHISMLLATAHLLIVGPFVLLQEEERERALEQSLQPVLAFEDTVLHQQYHQFNADDQAST